MPKLEDFLKKIHVQDSILEKLKSDEDIDLEVLSKEYIDSRQDYFSSSLMPDKIKVEVDKTVKGMTLKAIKQVNKTFGFGFTNTQMEEFETIDKFMEEAEKLHRANLDSLTKGQKDDLVKQVNSLKEQVTDKQEEIDRITQEKENEIKRIEKDKNKEVRLFKAKDHFERMVKADKDLPDLPGKDFAIEYIKEKIFSQYDVQEDGRILNKDDGTIPTHPDPSRPVAIKTIEDIYPYYKGLAGLVKRNSVPGQGNKVLELNPDGTPKEAGPSEKYLLEQIK